MNDMNEKSIFKKYDNSVSAVVPIGQKPKTVKVVNIPPKSGEKPQYEEIPIAQIEKEHNFEWIEGFKGPEEFMAKHVIADLEKNRVSLSFREKVIFETLKKSGQYSSDFALYYINDVFGWGVKYEGINPIPKNTIVGFYAGAFAEASEKGGDDYASIGIKSKLFASQAGERPTSCIDAKTCGNITRFINSMPHNLEQYEFATGIDRKDVLAANIAPELLVIGEIPIKVFVTVREIRQGDSLGFEYGEDYWATQESKHNNGQGKQLLFKSDGTVIPPYMYRRKKVSVHVEDLKNELLRDSAGVQIFSLMPAAQCQEIISHPETLAGVGGPDGQLVGISTPEEVTKALVRNNYPYGGQLKDISQIDKSKTVNMPGVEILKQHVDSRFCGYQRKNDNSQLDIIDAVIEVKNDKEKTDLLKKLGSCGIFPLIFDKTIIIEGINQTHIYKSVERLRARKYNKAGVIALHGSNYVDAIENFSQSVWFWTCFCQENPKERNELAVVHHNLARAYQRSGNIAYAAVHFYFSEKLYDLIGNTSEAQKEKGEKDLLIEEINKSQSGQSDLISAAQSGISQFPLKKHVDLLPELQKMSELFLSDQSQYKNKYSQWPVEQQKLMDLFLQINGLYKIENKNSEMLTKKLTS